MEWLNLAFYKFTEFSDPKGLQERLIAFCRESCPSMKGTILVSHEGLNCFVAVEAAEGEVFIRYLTAIPGLEELFVKRSYSEGKNPYSRMLIKLKPEIIPMGIAEVKPAQKTGRRISPEELAGWYRENKDFVILDTRNQFEFDLGTFKNALSLGLKNFREFPKKLGELPEDTRDKPVVMFCTGGIRCEKATAAAELQGFRDVYQLDGGILNYFEKVGGENYTGDCFVFDKRVALAPDLKPSGRQACFECRTVMKDGETRESHRC